MKIRNLFDPGSGMEKFGSRMNIRDLQHCIPYTISNLNFTLRQPFSSMTGSVPIGRIWHHVEDGPVGFPHHPGQAHVVPPQL
jgi:hypothetical protein